VATRPAVRIAERLRFITKDTFIVFLLAVGKKTQIKTMFLASFNHAALPLRPDAMDVNLGLSC
jgi:hypothetical protein